MAAPSGVARRSRAVPRRCCHPSSTTPRQGRPSVSRVSHLPPRVGGHVCRPRAKQLVPSPDNLRWRVREPQDRAPGAGRARAHHDTSCAAHRSPPSLRRDRADGGPGRPRATWSRPRGRSARRSLGRGPRRVAAPHQRVAGRTTGFAPVAGDRTCRTCRSGASAGSSSPSCSWRSAGWASTSSPAAPRSTGCAAARWSPRPRRSAQRDITVSGIHDVSSVDVRLDGHDVAGVTRSADVRFRLPVLVDG